MPGGAEFVESMVAVALLGAVAVPLNARYRLELADVVRRADLAYLLTTNRGRLGGEFPATIARCFPGLPGQPYPTALRPSGAPACGQSSWSGLATRVGILGRGSWPARVGPRPVRSQAACGRAGLHSVHLGHDRRAQGRTLATGAGPRRRRERETASPTAGMTFLVIGPAVRRRFRTASRLLRSRARSSRARLRSRRVVGLLRRDPPTRAPPWFPAIIQGLFEASRSSGTTSSPRPARWA